MIKSKEPQRPTIVEIQKDELKDWSKISDLTLNSAVLEDIAKIQNEMPKQIVGKVSFKDSERSNKLETGNSPEINKNRVAFDIFVKKNLDNPEFREKYVVFVNELLEAVADSDRELVKKSLYEIW